jgi:hypothetical protein
MGIAKSSLLFHRRALAPLALLLAGLGAAAAADASHPAVVELYQSQGCSSCPPANARLDAISQRADVLALSFSVTYWDGLGWKDTFARGQFTQRQYAYAHAMGADGVYTPQVIVNGRVKGVGADEGEIEALMRRAERPAGPTVAIGAGAAEIGAAATPSGVADVWLVRYDPRRLEVPVLRGENAGRTLPHRNIVREFVRLGGWSGAPARFALPAPTDPALATAILVQAPGAGPIIAAAKG